MKRVLIASAAAAVLAVLVVLAIAAGRQAFRPEVDSVASASPAISPSTAPPPTTAAPRPSTTATPADEIHRGFLYGRVATEDGATYEGRLRWAGDQEAFWSDFFNGVKDENTWATQVPPERLPRVRDPIKVLGLEIAQRERELDLGRRFMSRFGEIARIDVRGRDVNVTLKSGTVFDLDLYESSDFDDGVRVWDAARGVVDLGPRQIRTIEFFPAAGFGAAPARLYGTVRTAQGEFTGFVQWDRQECVGEDELDGRAADGEVSLRFDTIRSIARQSGDSSRVTLLDGREIGLSGSNDVGEGHRGTYVDDPRYGRVLVSWDAFERIDFAVLGEGGSGPAYGDFPPGRPLTGSVTTRDGRRLAGRLVYDLDESETTETFDAPSQGVDYTIPFGLVASIVLSGPEERATVTLHSGEVLQLERDGDLGEGNAGMLIFLNEGKPPEYVPWTELERVELDRPPAIAPPADQS